MTRAVLERFDEIEPGLVELYQDLHRHPELSYAEERTAARVAERLAATDCEVTTGLARTGVVGMLRNGGGPTVLLRADMDALPVRERTGLPYSSTETAVGPEGVTVPVMHACGHDMHMACLLGTVDLLARSRSAWSGTVMAVFQPAEEAGTGARAMLDDGLYERLGSPDIVLGQHVAPFPAGHVALRAGPSFAATDSVHVTLYGHGAHGSVPEMAIDPVVMAAAAVLRLQTVVSREVAGGDTAVLTVGTIHAGVNENVIPDRAEMKLSLRTYKPHVRQRMLHAVERIVRAEAAASGAEREPDITISDSFPVLENDAVAVERTRHALATTLGEDRVVEAPPLTGGEDVAAFATAAQAPICYWLFGGSDPQDYATAVRLGTVERDVPSNHQSTFAPLVEPTLTTGVEALTSAALAWLSLRLDLV